MFNNNFVQGKDLPHEHVKHACYETQNISCSKKKTRKTSLYRVNANQMVAKT
jgi:hypothetical protein